MPDLKTLVHNSWVADAAWWSELVRVFGKQAVEARYLPRGEGDLGSELRRLYDARIAAMKAERAAWEAYRLAPRETTR